MENRYDYDPYGRRVKLTAASNDPDFGYTGHYYHAPSGLHLALYRAYSADLGRWISRDPIGEVGGLNLYGYVNNRPIYYVDPLGLQDVVFGISFDTPAGPTPASMNLGLEYSPKEGFSPAGGDISLPGLTGMSPGGQSPDGGGGMKCEDALALLEALLKLIEEEELPFTVELKLAMDSLALQAGIPGFTAYVKVPAQASSPVAKGVVKTLDAKTPWGIVYNMLNTISQTIQQALK